MQINLALFGRFALTIQGAPVKFATDQARALCAYLAVEPGAHDRSTLAALLWPEQPENVARQNLRQALLHLKQGLHTISDLDGDLDQILTITTRTLQFHPGLVTVDVTRFQTLWAACNNHEHTALAACIPCLARLQQAVELYQGEFLQGFFLKNSLPFEEWVSYVRGQLHRHMLEALNHLALAAEAAGTYERMQQYATRQLALEPWREEAHQQVMRALALNGQGSAALAHYLVCRRVLQEELGVAPSPATVALYEQIKRGALLPTAPRSAANLPPSPPVPNLPQLPLALATSPRHNLPAHLPLLVGREEQLQQLYALLCQSKQQLVTLVGMGGIGKTSLALALMARMVGEQPAPFTHGVWFIPLVGVVATQADLPAALAETIGRVVGLPAGNQEAQPTALFHYLAQRQALLLLDNFEHLLAAETSAKAATIFLLTLLQATPGVKLLVTSRTPLQVQAEAVARLEGLPVPSGATTRPPTSDDAGAASVRLFVYHAQRALPSFALTSDNLAAVIQLCRFLGGMPLAIELAAPLAAHLSPAELLVAIQQNLGLLTSPRLDLDARHQRITAIFDYTWELLTADEQRALVQMAIFVGPFSWSALQAITQTTPLVVMALANKALVQQMAVGRYQLHELVRHFAVGKVAAWGEAFYGALQLRYVAYYLGFVSQRAAALRHRQATTVIGEIRQEGENIARAWQLALAHGQVEPVAGALDGLLAYWRQTGRHREGETLLADALPVGVKAAGGNAEAPPLPTGLLAKLWLVYADCLYEQTRFKAALEVAAKASALADGDSALYALGLIIQAECLCWQSRYAAAKPLAEQAYVLAQAQGAWAVEIRALIVLTWYRDTQAEKLALVTQALQIAQQQGDPYFERVCLQHLAGTCENGGDYARSLPYRADGLALAQAAQDPFQLGQAAYLCGLVHAHLGLYTEARHLFHQALTLAQEHSFVWLTKRCQNRLAMVYTCLGQIDAADHFSAQARTPSPGHEEMSPFFLFTYGRILGAQGKAAQQMLLLQALLRQKRTEAAERTTWLPELAELAQLAVQQNDKGAALAYAEEILAILQQHPRFSMSDVYFDRYAIDLACYCALHAAQDARATSVLVAGYGKLWAQAEQISDTMLRRAYLENVRANRELVACWQYSQPRGEY
jgi:DNA-binding SARP family transcriptional activator/predicted ATPase